MNIVYLIELNKEIPNKYIGSKTNCIVKDGKIFNGKKEYWGSSSSSEYQKIVQEDLNVDKKMTVLEIVDSVSAYDVLKAEQKWQEKYDVVANPEFYNKNMAVVSNYSDPNYATYKHVTTGKRARLPRNHEKVKDGTWVGITKGRIRPEKEKTALRIANTGEGNPFYGKHHTTDSLKKISTGIKKAGYVMVGSHKRHFIDAVSKPKSENHKKNIGDAHKGKNTVINPSTGHKIWLCCDSVIPEGYVSFQKYTAGKHKKLHFCKWCSKEYFPSVGDFSKFCCKSCRDISREFNRKKTNLMKYGVEYVMQNEYIKLKNIETKRKKHNENR